MDNSFLIPANSKKSMLIFGLFNKFDLILAVVGVSISVVLLLLLPVEELTFALIALIPGLVASFLVLPVPNYHNILTFLKGMFEFFTTRQRYTWEGWCFGYEQLNEQSNKK